MKDYSTSASQKRIVSYANKRCGKHTRSPLPWALNPLINLAPSTLFNILLNTSIIIKNIMDHLELPKKSFGDSFTKTENWTVEIQVRIHLHHLSPKHNIDNKCFEGWYLRISSSSFSIQCHHLLFFFFNMFQVSILV